MSSYLALPPNKQLERTVTRRRGRGACASLHSAHAPRWTAHRAAAELRRYTRTTDRSGKSMSAFDLCGHPPARLYALAQRCRLVSGAEEVRWQS